MKILVGYENSNVANHALEVAIKHARAFNAQLIVVTSMKGGPEVPRKTFDLAEKTLERAKSAVKKKGVACDTRLSVQGLGVGVLWL